MIVYYVCLYVIFSNFYLSDNFLVLRLSQMRNFTSSLLSLVNPLSFGDNKNNPSSQSQVTHRKLIHARYVSNFFCKWKVFQFNFTSYTKCTKKVRRRYFTLHFYLKIGGKIKKFHSLITDASRTVDSTVPSERKKITADVRKSIRLVLLLQPLTHVVTQSDKSSRSTKWENFPSFPKRREKPFSLSLFPKKRKALLLSENKALALWDAF